MLTHKEIVNIGYNFVKKNFKYPVIFKEMTVLNFSREIPDVIAFGAFNRSIVLECKISRADFLKDRKKPFRIDQSLGMGKYRFYLAPKGLISEAELPSNWGLIEISEKGKPSIAVNPYCTNPYGNVWRNVFAQNVEAERAFLYSVIRRLDLPLI